jgi:hypothetical protein
MSGEMNTWFSWGWQQRLWHVLILGVSAMAIYIISLRLTGIRIADFMVRQTVK